MKRNKVIWNYIDMLLTTLVVFAIIFVLYMIAESLERYIYRYTIFPFIAFILIFVLGLFLGRAFERTKKKKPIGLISNKMAKLRKQKNVFIFNDDGIPYSPRKEVIEDIKSGEIVHVKQIHHSEFETEEFNEIYNISVDDIIDDKMNANKSEED